MQEMYRAIIIVEPTAADFLLSREKAAFRLVGGI